MEAGDGETRSTRRVLSEARSRGRTTTIENPTTSNPFVVLTTQTVGTGVSGEDSENEATDDTSPSQATPRAPKPKRTYVARTPKEKTTTTDKIVVASDGEGFNDRPQRRLRKPSEKAKQNEVFRDVLEAGRLDGFDEPAMRGNIQDQMNEQTGILKTLLKGWMKQEAHNKKMEAKLANLKRS